MNERIRELAEESYNEFYNIHIDLELFAELIVRECVSLMESEKDYYSKPGSYESQEYYERMAAKEDAFDYAACMIRSHFGVK